MSSARNQMTSARRLLAALVMLAAIWLSACGSDEAETDAAVTTTTSADETEEAVEEDHDDHAHDEDEAAGGLGAHEHGVAEMTVAWIGDEVAIDVVSPAFNIFGFEYVAVTDEDIAIVAERTEAITAAGVLTLDEAASCELSVPATTDLEQDGSHSELTITWLFVCENPDEVSHVDATNLFATFPNFEDIDAQWVSETDQSSAELTADSPTLVLRS